MREIIPIQKSVLGETGERNWPFVFSMDGPLAYSFAFPYCNDNIEAARVLQEAGVLRGPVMGHQRWRSANAQLHAEKIVEWEEREASSRREGECADDNDDLLVVRFADRAKAEAFIDRLNGFLRSKAIECGGRLAFVIP